MSYVITEPRPGFFAATRDGIKRYGNDERSAKAACKLAWERNPELRVPDPTPVDEPEEASSSPQEAPEPERPPLSPPSTPEEVQETVRTYEEMAARLFTPMTHQLQALYAFIGPIQRFVPEGTYCGPVCMGCDGCGWCEGSPAYTCRECDGTGNDPHYRFDPKFYRKPRKPKPSAKAKPKVKTVEDTLDAVYRPPVVRDAPKHVAKVRSMCRKPDHSDYCMCSQFEIQRPDGSWTAGMHYSATHNFCKVMKWEWSKTPRDQERISYSEER